MTKSTNRTALIALLAVVACALIATGVGIHRAKSSELGDLQRTLTQKRQEVEEVKFEVKQMLKLEASYEDLHRQVSILEPNLPTEAYIPTFLSQLQGLASETGNQLVSVRPLPKRKLPVAAPAPESDVVSKEKQAETEGSEASKLKAKPKVVEPPYDEISIEVKLEGSYWSTMKFLEELKAFPKMIAVNDVSVKPKNARFAVGTQPLLNIEILLTAVTAKEKKDGKAK